MVFVPALTGLGSPWWDPDARGLITGLTRGTTRAHLVRAALEAIAHQVADVIDALPDAPDRVLRADGGATANGFLMQFQADLLGCRSRSPPSARRPRSAQPRSPPGHEVRVPVGAVYEPALARDRAAEHRSDWRSALARAKTDSVT